MSLLWRVGLEADPSESVFSGMAYSNERSRLKHLEMHEKAPDRQVGVDAILYA